jgi:hypothetical protein
MLSFFSKITNILLSLCAMIIIMALYLPTKGVKTSNNIEQYASKYLAKHQILNPEEKLTAYYDSSFMMNSKDALVLTNKRIIHHYNQQTFSINLEDVA